MLSRRLPLAISLLLAGCAGTSPVNPSFAIAPRDAQAMLDDAAVHPQPLPRPLVIVGGWVDPGFAAGELQRVFRLYTHDDRIVKVPLDFDEDFPSYRRRIVSAVQKAFPSDDPNCTVDVDVVAVSMGGIAARYAALKLEHKRRLQIHRLFTISAPHQGCATLVQAPIPLPDVLNDLRPGSPFLHRLNDVADAGSIYPIYPYVCLADELVGAAYAAPPGQRAWWVAAPQLYLSHNWGWVDPRIKADILRRLLGATPLSSEPPAPLPR